MPKPPPFEPTCILGLGNPGNAYKNTYHNAGILAALTLVDEAGLEKKAFHREKHFEYWRTKKHIIACSRTFMNESGLAARDIVKKFGSEPRHLMIVHDDSDLRIGTIRYAFGRGDAGHHGVISVMEHLGTKMFWRARIGIRVTNEKAESFVLRTIRKEDAGTLYGVLDAFAKKVTEKENP